MKIIEDEERSGQNRYSAAYRQAYGSVQQQFTDVALVSGTVLERLVWKSGFSESVREHDREMSRTALTPGKEFVWVHEELIALRYVGFIRYVLLQMRNFLEFVTTGFVLLVLATAAYPFRGGSALQNANTVLFLILGTGIVIAFMEMDRDPLLSRLSDTKPNELGKQFLTRILVYGALPVITLVASQFPSVSGVLLSWVQPTLQALK
jgi:hypothetical protein